MSGRPRHLKPVTLLAVVIAILTAVLAGAAPANAADRRAGGGRGELTAYYQHALGRAPDPSGLNTFGSIIDRDCRQGVLVAAYSLLTSPEAARYQPSTGGKVGMLYSALLNRVPDAGGYNAHYRSMVNGRSWNKVVTSVLASPEYRQRINSVCGGAPSSNATVFMGAESQALTKNLLDLGVASSVGCGASKIPGLVKKIRIGALPIGVLAAEAGKQTADLVGAKDACGSTARYFAAAAYSALLNQSGEAVYWRAVTTKGPRIWWRGGGCEVNQHIEIGSNPSSYRTFEGSQYMLICA